MRLFNKVRAEIPDERWGYVASADNPPPGSAFASFNNAPSEAYEAGLKYEREHPPNSSLAPSSNEIETIQSQGLNAYQFVVDPFLSGIYVNPSGFTVTFTQMGKQQPSRLDRSCFSRAPLIADFVQRPYAYFEVTIDDLLFGSEATVISIGLATSPYPPFRLIGWNQFSVGYHSDDGRLFQNDGFGGKNFGSPYSKGDTVGCGYDPARGAVFFTLNGAFIGYAPQNEQHPYHAAVGADGPCQLSINVGQEPFKYNPGAPATAVSAPAPQPWVDGGALPPYAPR
ncbi:hypothetical protein HK097_005423 [Rhizophlyctis rosea]|uniref:B30.2/SPRY domain-containing protein n=1 Tax=Rhizophlyctis rosea TaxID=64517 RepID=A0AAD5X5J4_9FUNG|nr:hypothetical protein HK097_005423 [Rhizophlyctis rosea]